MRGDLESEAIDNGGKISEFQIKEKKSPIYLAIKRLSYCAESKTAYVSVA